MENKTVISKGSEAPERHIHPSVAKIIMRYFKSKGYWVSELMAIDDKLFAVQMNNWFAVGVVLDNEDRDLQILHKVKL